MTTSTATKTTLAGLGAIALITASSLSLAAGKLNVSNWAEYMAGDTIPNFEKEFDVEVTFTPYDSVEAIDSKLLAGNSGYDVVAHAASQVARLTQGNILRKIDKTKLPNLKHMNDITRPVLIAHGSHDEMIGPSHARKLAETSAGPRRLHWFEGAGHNDTGRFVDARFWESVSWLLGVAEEQSLTP